MVWPRVAGLEGVHCTTLTGPKGGQIRGTNQDTLTTILTEFHPNVLVGVILPELVILCTVAHHGEDDVLKDHIKLALDQLPGVRMVHSEGDEGEREGRKVRGRREGEREGRKGRRGRGRRERGEEGEEKRKVEDRGRGSKI